MTLEIDRIGTGKQYLASSGWDAGSSYDSEADAELMRDDLEDAAKQAEQKKKKGFFDCELHAIANESTYCMCVVRTCDMTRCEVCIGDSCARCNEASSTLGCVSFDRVEITKIRGGDPAQSMP